MKKLFSLSYSLQFGLLIAVNSQTLPVDFETTTSWSVFAGASFSTVSNPYVDLENPSSKVGRMIKGAGQNWAGAYLTLGSSMDFFNNDTFSIKVRSSKLNTKLLLKVENSLNSTINYEKEITMTKYNEWETLTFDFSQIPNENYDRIVLIFDLGVTGNGSSSFTYYVDDITLYSLNGPPEPCDSNLTGNVSSGSNYVLVWADEFTEDGELCYENWTYDLGTGSQGWGNFEAQSYTNSSENVRKENGMLKITAIKSGNSYTSARIKTKNLFDFTYGRIEISAKLPSTAGTWPAVWLLGSNINEVSWPQCGEIDIIEQFSNKQENISTAHWYSDGNAQYGLSVNNSTLTSSFNTFRLDWTPTSLTAYLNDSQYWVMSINNTMPFFDNFFLIANLALGGNKGAGNIDPNFSEDSLEIDYIRVYQNSYGSVMSTEAVAPRTNNQIKHYYLDGNLCLESMYSDIQEVSIFDVSGRIVYHSVVKAKSHKFPRNSINNGLLFIKILNNKEKKIIKILN